MSQPSTQRWPRGPIVVAVVATALIGLAISSIGIDLVDANIAPLCSTDVASAPLGIMPSFDDTRAHADVVMDGHAKADYHFALEPSGTIRNFTVNLPWRMKVARIVVLGWGEQRPAKLQFTSRGPSPILENLAWQARNGVPPIAELRAIGLCDSFALDFQCDDLVLLNDIAVQVSMPRWQAIALWVGTHLLVPWTFGCIGLFTILGLGGLVHRYVLRQSAFGDSERLVIGLLLIAAVGAALSIWPMTWHALIFVPMAAIAGCCYAAFEPRDAIPQTDDRSLRRRVAFLALLLTTHVAVETHLVRGNRVEPFDHLMPLYGARRLAAGLDVPAIAAARPWLVHLLYVPVERFAGRLSYPLYLGFMSALNATSLLAVAALAQRWSKGNGVATATIFACMPGIIALHFFGQRPFSAGLLLLALTWSLNATPRPVVAGMAALLAVMAHPGALFVLPGIFAMFAFGFRQSRHPLNWRLSMPLLIPAAGYFAWTLFTRWQFSTFRNPLNLYPLWSDLASSPPGDTWHDAVSKLAVEDWWTLATNRVRQCADYVWSTSVRDPVVELFRPITLFNCLGIGGALCLLLLRRKPMDWSLMLAGVALPLVVHHMYIGQAHGQFHISPLPFMILATMTAATVADSTSKLANWLIRAEWFMRSCWPSGLAIAAAFGLWTTRLENSGPFGGDVVATVVAASLPPALWLWMNASLRPR